ncbi:hypothetical protein SH611_04185 [Geminicoccaceae bacterium 1502E]|nr:hypothetical protein [Geminicoccaceae bacterium 1502E]
MTSTFTGALTMRGMIAADALRDASNPRAFEACVEEVLVPGLRCGDIVIMGNVTSPE